jgi:hypothetical protein
MNDSLTDLIGTDLINWRELPPGERGAWWNKLWIQVTALADRYRLTLRRGWWEDSIQVEALAAFCSWLRLFDSGANTDAPAKLQLLWELERLRAALRAGEEAFDPRRDRSEFEMHVASTERPRGRDDDAREQAAASSRCRQITGELASVDDRLRELSERERAVQADGRESSFQVGHERIELRRSIEELTFRHAELQRDLAAMGGN